MKYGAIIQRDNEGRCVTIKMTRYDVIKEIVTNDSIIIASTIVDGDKRFFYDDCEKMVAYYEL